MSLITAFVGASRVVVCADTQLSTIRGQGLDGWGIRKLFECGEHTLCAVAGLCTAQDPLRNVNDRVALVCRDPGLADRPAQLLQALSDELFAPMKTVFDADPEEFQNQGEGSGIIFAAVAVQRAPLVLNGRVTLSELRFPISKNEAGLWMMEKPAFATLADRKKPRKNFAYFLPQTEVAGIDLRAAMDPDAPEDEVLESADRIYAARASAEISKSPDVAILQALGTKWLRRNEK